MLLLLYLAGCKGTRSKARRFGQGRWLHQRGCHGDVCVIAQATEAAVGSHKVGVGATRKGREKGRCRFRVMRLEWYKLWRRLFAE